MTDWYLNHTKSYVTNKCNKLLYLKSLSARNYSLSGANLTERNIEHERLTNTPIPLKHH